MSITGVQGIELSTPTSAVSWITTENEQMCLGRTHTCGCTAMDRNFRSGKASDYRQCEEWKPSGEETEPEEKDGK